MNPRQVAFYRQAASDWDVYCHLRSNALPVCHELHYLQMCTEKLAKAYYRHDLRNGHAAFRRFLNDLPVNAGAVAPLGFADAAALTRWQLSVTALVGAIEDLAPAIADRNGGPNPEYPWPRAAPATAPVDHDFRAEVSDRLAAQAAGTEPPFLAVLGRMVATMRPRAWHL